jgi:hypothetical protein
MTAFTICSNNYIPKAQVLCASIKKLSPIPVYLFLADIKQQEIMYDTLGFDKVVFLEELPILNLQWMKERYNVIEFNTAIKPFAFQYILQTTPANAIYYFDPDIKVYQPVEAFEDLWKNQTIFLTPHALTPLPLDDKFPGENLFLNHGTFNLGFLAIRRAEVCNDFLKWWSDRLKEHCVIDLREGYFVDQIWCNLVPIYYKEHVKISDHPGLNVAYWNLHERRIGLVQNEFLVNNQVKLFFYHFSHFDINLRNLSPRPENSRFNFDNRPDLIELYLDYKLGLMQYKVSDFSTFKYFNGSYPVLPPAVPIYKRVIKRVKKEMANNLRNGR